MRSAGDRPGEPAGPRPAHGLLRSGLAVLLAVLAVTTAGCAAGPSAARTPSVAAPASGSPSHTPAPMVLGKSQPVRVGIPAIGVDSELMDLGVRGDGKLEVPPDGFPAGWFTGAPTPGELGPAVLAGHVDWGGSPGVFYRLRDLVTGDEITVDRADGSTAVFRVQRVERFGKDAFPTDAVYGDLDHAGLRVITCGGSFDEHAGSYEDNIVVFAALVAAERG